MSSIESYRVVITMRFMDDSPPKEIARALGVTENVVSVRITAASSDLVGDAQRSSTYGHLTGIIL